MRTKTTKTKAVRVNAATLSDLTDYAPSTISAFTKDGLLVRGRDGLYDRDEALRVIAQHEEERANDGNAVSKSGEIAKLRAELLRERIIGVKHENAVAAGKVHDKDECCQSLIHLLTATSVELHGLGRRIKAAFPEVGSNLIAAIHAQVDESIRRLKYGLAYRGEYFCPKCNALIDEYRREPLPEDER